MENMTVKECFSKCDIEKLLTEFFCYWRTEDKPVPGEKYRKDFIEVIEGIGRIEPNAGDKVIGMNIFEPDHGDKTEAELMMSVNEKGTDMFSIDVFIDEPGAEVTSSFKCEAWENVLGFGVPDTLIEELGLETIMAAILYEMTWFGFNAEEIHKFREELGETLEGMRGRK